MSACVSGWSWAARHAIRNHGNGPQEPSPQNVHSSSALWQPPPVGHTMAGPQPAARSPQPAPTRPHTAARPARRPHAGATTCGTSRTTCWSPLWAAMWCSCACPAWCVCRVGQSLQTIINILLYNIIELRTLYAACVVRRPQAAGPCALLPRCMRRRGRGPCRAGGLLLCACGAQPLCSLEWQGRPGCSPASPSPRP